MLKRFGLAGVLMAVWAIAPMTASAENRYDTHNQPTRVEQVRNNNRDGRRDDNGRLRNDRDVRNHERDSYRSDNRDWR